MTGCSRQAYTALVTLTAAIASGPVAAETGRLTGMLEETGRGGTYITPRTYDAVLAQPLFEQLLRATDGLDDHTELNSLGFRISGVSSHLRLISESPDRKEGRGAYVFRLRRDCATSLQAPHSFKDLHTGTLLVRLMEEETFSTAALNTMPRRYKDSSGVTRQSDLAHAEGTIFIAFSRALARVCPKAAIVQLHGFSEKKRRSKAGATADIIISNGTKWPSRRVSRLHSCLLHRVSENTRLYPREVGELGGTTNSVGAALRDMGFEGFVHVELSYGMRKSLLEDTGLRKRFATCLTERE